MKRKYDVLVSITKCYSVTVEASSKRNAENMALRMAYAGKLEEEDRSGCANAKVHRDEPEDEVE